MGQIPGRRSHGQCLTLLIMNDDVTRTTNGGGGVVTQKKTEKTALNLKFAVAFGFLGCNPPPPPQNQHVCYDQYDQYDN